jgi:hypothetical protein
MSADTADLVIRGILVLAILVGVARVAAAGGRTDRAIRDLDEAIEKFNRETGR